MYAQEIVNIFGAGCQVVNMTTRDEIEWILQKEFKLKKHDFDKKIWEELIKKCSKKINEFNSYKNIVGMIKIDAAQTALENHFSRG